MFLCSKKGKEREDQQPPISFLGGVTAVQALSNNNNSTHSLANTMSRNGRSILRTTSNDIHHSEPSTPLKKRPNAHPYTRTWDIRGVKLDTYATQHDTSTIIV